MRSRRSNPSSTTNTNSNKNLNKLNNSNNSEKKIFDNNTQVVGDNKPKQNRVFTCLFCNEVGHKKYSCPKYIQYERLQYQALLNEKKQLSIL